MGQTARTRTRRRIILGGTAATFAGFHTTSHAVSPRLSADKVLALNGYQEPSGAITLTLGGSTVDPYFAMKALLSAQQLGMNIDQATCSFVNWLKPFQRSDGSFDRFCRSGTGWIACQRADADDSTTALWMQLLCTVNTCQPGQSGGAPSDSFTRAQRLLESLRTRRGTYSISAELPVQLLMDNAEVYESLATCSRHFAQGGNSAQAALARRLRTQAEQLDIAVKREFWNSSSGQYRITSQARSESSFYPDAVAQLYPLLASMPSQAGPMRGKSWLQHWYATHQAAWFSGTADNYPWGLMAMAMAVEPRQKLQGLHNIGATNESDPIERWLAMATPLRHSQQRWNVLEEAIWFSLRNI